MLFYYTWCALLIFVGFYLCCMYSSMIYFVTSVIVVGYNMNFTWSQVNKTIKLFSPSNYETFNRGKMSVPTREAAFHNVELIILPTYILYNNN